MCLNKMITKTVENSESIFLFKISGCNNMTIAMFYQ